MRTLALSLLLILTAYFDSAAYQQLARTGKYMSSITPIGMNTSGQLAIAQPGDLLNNCPDQVQTDWNASSGIGQILNQPTLPSVTRTISSLSLSLVGTGATGTQISATKDSSISCSVSTSTTSTIGGPSTSLVTLKTCATNSSTEGDWGTVAVVENDQNITLAIVLQSTQLVKGQLTADLPAGWYAKLVNSGTGTHAESFISGQKTIYG